MDYQPDIWLVDAHAEGVRGDHDPAVVRHKSVKYARPRLTAEASMIRFGPVAEPSQGVPYFFYATSSGRIDDHRPGVPTKHTVESAHSVLTGADTLHSPWAVERLDDDLRVDHPEVGAHVLSDRRRRRRGQRQNGTPHPRPQSPDLAIGRPKVVPPLADAVGLVHCEQPYVAFGHQAEKWSESDALRSYEEHVECTRSCRLRNGPTLPWLLS